MSKGVKGVEVLLVGLNAEQARAVKTTEGPLLILAGAGSGKTKTLTHRIAYILATNRATAHNILAVTFTNKAAGEMRHRITELLGGSRGNRNLLPFMGTFHAICVRVLRRDGEYIGVPRNFVIWDEVDRLAAIKQVARKLNIDEKKFPPRLLAAMISGAKNEMVTAVEYADIAGSPAELTAAKV
ncbi:MAG TPA: UvrD-helicase domain-containing protein, partial [Candidatus Saccharimonadales bacterium]|nr:UvrD-helicase domain-containing protein [Candidatus Saccharimonadales bacterium]